MTSNERIEAGIKIGMATKTRIHGNGCQYPITFETPIDHNEDCTDLEIVFDRGKDQAVIILPLADWQIDHLLSQL